MTSVRSALFVRLGIAPDPILVANGLAGAADDVEIVLRESDDGQVALERAAAG